MAFLDIAIRAVDQASDTFRDISREAEDFGDEVEEAAKDAAKSIDKLGDEAIDAAKQVDNAGRNIASSLGNVGEAGGNAERGLMGVADTSEFLSTQLGLPLGPASGLASSFANLGGGIEALQQGFAGLIPQIMGILGPLAAKAAAWWAVAAGVIAANLPLIAIIATIALVVAGLVYFFTQTEAGKKTLEALTDTFNQQVLPALHAFSDFFTNTLLPIIKQAIEIYLLPLKATIQLIATTVQEVVAIVTALIKGDFAGAWSHAQALVQGFIDFFIGVPAEILSVLAGLVGQLFDLGARAVDGLRLGAINAGIALMQWFMDLPGEILRWIGDAGSILYNAGRDLVTGFFKGIGDTFDQGKDAVVDKLNPMNWGWRSPLDDSMYYEGDTAGRAFSTGLIHGVVMEWGDPGPPEPIKRVFVSFKDQAITEAGAAGLAAGQAYVGNFGSAVGGFGGNVPGVTPAPGAGGGGGGGGFQPGMPIMNTPDGLFYHDGTGWKPLTGAAAINPGTVQQPGGGTVSSPSLPPLPGGYEWQFVNGKWTPVYIGLAEPGSTHMDFGGGSYTGPGGHYTGAGWQLIPNGYQEPYMQQQPVVIQVNAIDAQSFDSYLNNGGGEQIAAYFQRRAAY